ncbi:MAG: methyltransferase domain-containing protein [Desulfobulbaceae bacterium]|nr:methyltransferase domain-containing protein [Desulfobulbaceae bacterium]
MSEQHSKSYFYLAADLEAGVLINDVRFSDFSERHKAKIQLPPLKRLGQPALSALENSGATGLIIEMAHGLLDQGKLNLAGKALDKGFAVLLHWPGEQAFEVVDEERFASFRRHRQVYRWLLVWNRTMGPLLRLKASFLLGGAVTLEVAIRLMRRAKAYAVNRIGEADRQFFGGIWPRLARGAFSQQVSVSLHIPENPLDAVPARTPALPKWLDGEIGPATPIPGTGVYLRLDFWAPISSGGSYGHTCYVAQSLSRVSENLVAFMPHRYALLDEMGIHQQIVACPQPEGNEQNIVAASDYYYTALKSAVELLRPAYIYERICLGNYAGARLSAELGIPYIVEYNGSEISMKRSFDGTGYEFEEHYLQCETVAFRQASLISVVSQPIREELIRRGVNPAKILVNPNGADIESYRPRIGEEKDAIRQELNLAPEHRVICFTGTFGGWHGVDVLAAAIPLICAADENIRFLLIGDGNHKHLVDDAVAKHRLAGRVISTGRVPQQQGARYLAAADVFVSPHNAHMVDSRFFGSPTKIFEYMAMAGGIVASDLEQIGEVLRPALRVSDFGVQGGAQVKDERAVLCRPGDIEEFVKAVVSLCGDPGKCTALGNNARQAVFDHYSWDRHVGRLWPAMKELITPSPATGPTESPLEAERIVTGDAYKDEVQNQWNQDACGSHYVKEASLHTLDWYLEAEKYRYGTYAPWMPEIMEFTRHAGEKVLEIGGGLGTDLSQFAKHGALVTDVDLSAGHLALAQENFSLRGLEGCFVHHDAERLPYDDNTFDVVYSNGVIHHTPNTIQVVRDIYRVLRPGGKAIIMVYAENSLHYWRNLMRDIGISQGELNLYSMGEIMSRSVEISEAGARPLVKVYTPRRLSAMFTDFTNISIDQHQLTKEELPAGLRWLPLDFMGRMMGWNLIIKAHKPGKR